MTATLPALLTATEFAKLPDPPDGSRDELVRGQVVIVGAIPTARHGRTCAKVNRVLGKYEEAAKLGRVVMRSGIILRRNPDTVRGPDLSYFSFDRLPTIPDDYMEVPPELVVEVLEKNETPPSVVERVRDFLDFGVPLIWLVDPEARIVTVYAGSMRGTEYDEADTLDGGTVLPGFSCLVADLVQ